MNKMTCTTLRVTSFLFLLVTISACSKSQGPLPDGMQTMTGVLLPAEISIVRRGTHLLTLQDGTLYFVESRAVHLREFEGLTVGLTGMLSKNTDPEAPPVLVAERIGFAASVPLRAAAVPSFGLSLRVPTDWLMTTLGSGVHFSKPGEANAVLSVMAVKSEELPYDPVTLELRASRITRTLLTLSGQRVIHIYSSRDGTESLYLPQSGIRAGTGGSILALLYRPSSERMVHPDPLFMEVAHTLSFTGVTGTGSSVSSRSSSVKGMGLGTGTGSIPGAPCGGVAGILCGPGEYCAITDRETNVGRCRKL
jgi:hypothetical protein